LKIRANLKTAKCVVFFDDSLISILKIAKCAVNQHFTLWFADLAHR